MANLQVINELSYSPSVIDEDDSESFVNIIWERRTAGTSTVEASGSSPSSWEWTGSGFQWDSGNIDVGSADTSAGADIYYQIQAGDTIPGADVTTTTAMTSGGFVAFTYSVSVPDISPGSTGGWNFDTYSELSDSDTAVPSGYPLSTVTISFNNLESDQYAGGETELVIESPEGTTYTEALTNYMSGTYTTSTTAFSGDTDSGGTWIVKFTDSYGDGGAYGTGITLEFS